MPASYQNHIRLTYLLCFARKAVYRDIFSDSPKLGSMYNDPFNAKVSGQFFSLNPLSSSLLYWFLILILFIYLFFYSYTLQIDIFVQVLQADGGKWTLLALEFINLLNHVIKEFLAYNNRIHAYPLNENAINSV